MIREYHEQYSPQEYDRTREMALKKFYDDYELMRTGPVDFVINLVEFDRHNNTKVIEEKLKAIEDEEGSDKEEKAASRREAEETHQEQDEIIEEGNELIDLYQKFWRLKRGLWKSI